MTYDARRKEVFEELEEKKYDEETREYVEKMLNEYFKIREGLIANTLDVLDPSGKRKNHGPWVDRGNKNMSKVREMFGKAEKGKSFLAKINNEEFKFFFHLSFSRVCVHRDKMVRHANALRKAMKEFENKWKEIKRNDEQIDYKVKKVAEEYEKILVKAAHEAARVERNAKEELAESVHKSVKAGTAFIDATNVLKLLSGATDILRRVVSEQKARKMEIFALLSHEEKVYACFEEARDIVEEFLDENGYPCIKDAWDDGEDASEDTVKKMLTDGQKRDASVWAKEVRDELSKVFSNAEKAYREFAKKHEYLFFGPLGSSYYKELSDDDSWKRYSDAWKDKREDFDDLLRDRTLAASDRKILEVSLEGLSDEDRKKVYRELVDGCRELLKAWNQVKDVARRGADEIMDTRENTRRAVEAMT